MFATVNGIELYYEVQSEGKPLILAHGNSEDHTIFDIAAPILAKKYTVYLVDSRGHGESTKTSNNLNYETMADDIAEFSRQLKLEKPSYYGLGDGGIIGIIVASKYPDILSNLIVSGANLNPGGIKTWARWFLRIFNFLHPTNRFRLMLEHPNITDDELKPIKCRTLVLAGKGDMVVEEHTKYIASHVKGAELRLLDGETLVSYVVHSEKIAHIIEDFIK